jgi:hypothetical protein
MEQAEGRSLESGLAGPKKSANEFHALLRFDFSFCCRLSGKLKDGRFLALTKRGQENHFPIRKLERIMVRMRHVPVDLSKDRRFVTECSLPRPQEAKRHSCYLFAKGEFGSRKNAHCHRKIFLSSESARAGPKIACCEPVADVRRTRHRIFKAIVAHVGTPVWSPQPNMM